MIAAFYRLGIRLVKRKSSDNDNQLYLLLPLFIAIAFTLAMHLAMALFFAVCGVAALSLANLSGALISALGCFLVMRHRSLAAGLLLSIEVSAYTLFAEYLVGFDSYLFLYLFLVLTIQFMIPYSKRPVRVGITVLLLILLLAQVQIEAFHVAPFDLGKLGIVFSTLNVVVTFLGTILGQTVNNYAKISIEEAREERRVELESQAHTDPLTGLYNRRYAELYFDEIQRDRRDIAWCVAMLDIDDFKQINDTHGHAQGDVVLKTLADYLANTLRKSDVVFRWGGEEFLMLMSSVEIGVAHHVLDKVRLGMFGNADIMERVTFPFTVTIGVAPLDPNDVAGSIDQADRKLYLGKKAGKNQVVS